MPGSRLRGKKGRRLREAGIYINAFEKLRDPSHHHCLSLDEWFETLQEAGFTLLHQETAVKRLDFDSWAARMQVSAANRLRLRAMLIQAPETVADFFAPQFLGDRVSFQLLEAIIIGKLERNAPGSS